MAHEVKRGDGWETVQIQFKNFSTLSTERDVNVNYVHSPFTCIGHEWRVDLFPGGDEDSSDGKVAIYLANRSKERIVLNYFMRVRNSDGKEIAYVCGEDDLAPPGSDSVNCAHDSNFCSHAELLQTLVDGALVVKVGMKLIKSSGTPAQFIIENPFCKNMLKKFMNEESADVVFAVRREVVPKGNGLSKEAATTPHLFHAHKIILEDGAPILYELCKSNGGTIPIDGVNPDTFRHMLLYIYGGKVEEEYLKENSKEIMDASDKYGVAHLKLQAEVQYVKSTKLDIYNVMDNLLYADSLNCALLKETVMDFLVENAHIVVRKLSFQNVPGYLMKDLLAAMSIRDTRIDGDIDYYDYNIMRITTLRAKLHEKGLDIDGSRETMIARLTDHSETAS